MSTVVVSNANPVGAFQEYFGVAPDGRDKQTECERWERLCGALLADRERLRSELEKQRLDSLCGNFKLEQTRDEVYAQVNRECSMEQIIADLERQSRGTA